MEDIYTNTRPFCLMAKELQEKLLDHVIKGGDLQFLDSQGNWVNRFSGLRSFDKYIVYRAVKIPVIEKVTLFGSAENRERWWGYKGDGNDTHKITYNIVDGKVDVFSITMEKL